VTVLALCGNADIYVPEGVDVDVRGLSIFGHLRDRGRDVVRPDAPVVHVRVFGLIGTADVWRVPHELRGTYRGLAHPAVTEHLLGLGVTAVELLPVHQFVHDRFLADRGLRNYWGYQSIGYFAPHNEYGSADDGGGQIDDFKAMVFGPRIRTPSSSPPLSSI